MSTISAGSFGGPMSHTAALYFTVTVFSTVGFGDITAKTDAARLVVTGQMVVNIVIIGFVVKAFSFMVTARREHQPTAGAVIEPGHAAGTSPVPPPRTAAGTACRCCAE